MAFLSAALQKDYGPDPIPTRLQRLRQQLWVSLHFERTGPQAILLVVLSVVAVAAVFYIHSGSVDEVILLYPLLVPLSKIQTESYWLAAVLKNINMALFLSIPCLGIMDALFYKKIVGRPFPWETLINIAAVNFLFAVLLPPLIRPLNRGVFLSIMLYTKQLNRVPTLIHLNGYVALLVAVFLEDFSYYWAHRWGHKIRLFWNLGHSAHHRIQGLTSLTAPLDPPIKFLNFVGPRGALRLLLVPIVARLITTDYQKALWGGLVLVAIECWLEPSHSPVLWQLEIKFPILRWARLIFVTPMVHCAHHAKGPEYNLSDGCNFAARFSILDRLFGTYAEPPNHIPELGLMDDKTDYYGTPLRFIIMPYVKFIKELRYNRIRHWPVLIFGHTGYEPPVRVE